MEVDVGEDRKTGRRGRRGDEGGEEEERWSFFPSLSFYHPVCTCVCVTAASRGRMAGVRVLWWFKLTIVQR